MQQWLEAHVTSITKVGCLFSSSCSSNALPPPTMATQINDITKRLQHCAAVKVDVDERLRYTKAMFPNNESDVIGREVDKEIIIEKLLMHHHHDDDQSRLSVLPIVGMGGLGKSTLAKIVLCDKRILESFLVQIWVSVSHDFDIEQVIVQMINSVCFFDSTYRPINKGQLNMIQLLERLQNKLVGKKFLLVLDDVRKEDPLKWDELINIIPTGFEPSSGTLYLAALPTLLSLGTNPNVIDVGFSLTTIQDHGCKNKMQFWQKSFCILSLEKYNDLWQMDLQSG
ncbi:hypothetical protein RIF29_39415 [Crotalaria pallida]|uniref:NB-ARC domain-containing protein n=1 Tax=Crotalaria pallida TaxID=3830 RepID=A0AAN9HPR8_CROPI